MDQYVSEKEKKIESLRGITHYHEVAKALEMLEPVPGGLVGPHNRLTDSCREFYDTLFNAWNQMWELEEDKNYTTIFKDTKVLGLYADLGEKIPAIKGEITDAVNSLAAEMARRSKPRPPSDDAVLNHQLLSVAKEDVRLFVGSDKVEPNLVRRVEKLFESSLEGGNYALCYLLCDDSWMVPFLQTFDTMTATVYKADIHPKFHGMLATEKTQPYMEAKQRAREIWGIPEYTNTGWYRFQKSLPPAAQATIDGVMKSYGV